MKIAFLIPVLDEINIEKTYNRINEACDIEHDVFFAINGKLNSFFTQVRTTFLSDSSVKAFMVDRPVNEHKLITLGMELTEDYDATIIYSGKELPNVDVIKAFIASWKAGNKIVYLKKEYSGFKKLGVNIKRGFYKMGISMLGIFKDRCAEFKKAEHLNFGVYYTPAENLCYTAMKKFKDKYGEIENVSDKDFFTNSIHVPVWKKVSPLEKIDIESQLTGYSNAGCITYVELESTCKNNLEALEQIVNYAMDKDIPYFAINVPNDTCLECGYTDEFNDKCPICGSEHIQQLRRVTGYLTGDYKTAFNKGKQQEVELRYKHTKELSDDEWKR